MSRTPDPPCTPAVDSRRLAQNALLGKPKSAVDVSVMSEKWGPFVSQFSCKRLARRRREEVLREFADGPIISALSGARPSLGVSLSFTGWPRSGKGLAFGGRSHRLRLHLSAQTSLLWPLLVDPWQQLRPGVGLGLLYDSRPSSPYTVSLIFSLTQALKGR